MTRFAVVNIVQHYEWIEKVNFVQYFGSREEAAAFIKDRIRQWEEYCCKCVAWSAGGRKTEKPAVFDSPHNLYIVELPE